MLCLTNISKTTQKRNIQLHHIEMFLYSTSSSQDTTGLAQHAFMPLLRLHFTASVKSSCKIRLQIFNKMLTITTRYKKLTTTTANKGNTCHDIQIESSVDYNLQNRYKYVKNHLMIVKIINKIVQYRQPEGNKTNWCTDVNFRHVILWPSLSEPRNLWLLLINVFHTKFSKQPRHLYTWPLFNHPRTTFSHFSC